MSQPSSESNKFEELIQALGKKSPEDDLELTGQEIAEILWLALKRQEFEQPEDIADVSVDRTENEAEKIAEIISKQLTVLPFVIFVEQRLYKLALLSLPVKKTPKIPPKTPPKQNISHSQSSTKAPVYSSSRSISSQDLPIGIPDAPSLREPLTLLKSLRLLMQKVSSGRKAGIDEEATVRRIAEEQLWIPVLQEEVEPWLDLALVIDESQSMLIWGHTIADLQSLFQKYGVFRELKVWGIKLDSTKTKVEFIARSGNSSRIADPKELIDLTRRRLILIVSDCVSNLWRKGIIFPTLNFWAEKQPLAIMQMLPRVMWRRSALGLGMLVNFSSSRLAVANQDLISSKVAPLPNVTKIPILSLERKPILEQTYQEAKYQQIYDWTEMLVGKRESLVSGYLLPPQLNIAAHPLLAEQQKAITNQNAAQRIERFRKMTSPLGRKLAGLLAAAPVIRLPIVRLIQESLLPDSGQIQVAEVFLGGLLKPKPEFISNGNVNPEAVEYEFIESEIRDMFLEDAPVSDSTDVLNAVSRYIAEQMGVSMKNFMAMLKGKQKADQQQQENTIKSFAEVTERVLRKLGGEYVEFAEELKKNISATTPSPPKKSSPPKDSKFSALLIGIDNYESIPTYPQLYKNLRGCVRDIDLVDSYLRKTLNILPEQIWKLTAPIQESNELGAIRAAQGNVLPTYENIVKAFEEITAAAQSGEQVYIHYSGHGGRAVTIYPELEGEQRQDEGIVPMDIGSSDGRYLRDVEMATLLKRLTDKGCIVTVIFDSCLSGSATRGDCAIRSNENNIVDTTARSQDSLVASREELLNNWRMLTQAEPELSTGWLPNANDYLFLAACRPSEFAYEYAVNGGQRNGALTYWMMDTLTSSTSVLSYKSLYNRVKEMIRSKFPQQLPMLIGNGDRLVFGDKRQYKPYAVTVIEVAQDGQEITLDAGLAAGLSSGTRFAIYPFDVSDFSDKTQQIAITELTDDIQADKSTAQILDAAAGGIEVKGKIEPGSSAVMVAAPVDLIRKVRLFADKQAGDKEQDLPADLVDKQTAALEKVRQALAGNGWVVEAQEDEEGYFQVAIAKDGTYEICIGMPLKNLRPALSIEDPDAAKKVVERLVHLTKYQSVQALDNPASELSNYLEVRWLGKLKDYNPREPNNLESELKTFTSSDNPIVQENEWVVLSIKNTFSKPLNIAVLALNADWSVSQIYPNSPQGITLSPGEEQKAFFQPFLSNDYEEETNIIKVFATRGMTNFQWLELPPLDRVIKYR